MGTQVDLDINVSEHGTQIIQVSVTTVAGADATIAHTFTRPFKAAPKVLGIARVDAGAAEAVTPSIPSASLLTTGFTLATKGTHAANATYLVTLLGKYV